MHKHIQAGTHLCLRILIPSDIHPELTYIYIYICIHVLTHVYLGTCREAPAGPSRAIRAGNVVDVYGAFDDCSSARDSFNVRSDQRFGCRGFRV